MRVGTSGDYAPFSWDGEGFDVEVARRLAGALGREPVFVPFTWPGLATGVRDGDFDVAMGGITWRPERAVRGWMSRAVAAGGPCLVSAAPLAGMPPRLAVNRGGVLERWARARFAGSRIEAVDDNRSLPDLLAAGGVDAFVTDSFELAHFGRPAWTSRCEPPYDRKVYWVTGAGGAELAGEIDAWIEANEATLQVLRERWLGAPGPRDEVDHLVDLLARRLALMPAVGAWKHAHGRAIEDRARERRVLERVGAQAAELGLASDATRALFRLQIELSKAIQLRGSDHEPSLDLETELRPLLLSLGDRILVALAEVAPIPPAALDGERLAPLAVLLEPHEQSRLRSALLAVAPAAQHVFRGDSGNRGAERYSAWFADTDGRVLYFGLSPFWTLWWDSGGDARADLREPGDLLIGRFDLDTETFLAPLRVGTGESSVWDVLAHSNGRIYYTTFFGPMGSVRADGSDAQVYAHLGLGLNELVEGPDGTVYASRYSSAPDDPGGETARYGAIVLIEPDGRLAAELRLPEGGAGFAAPKSLAVDPAGGEIWLNTDTFAPDGTIAHETLRLTGDGRLVERSSAPELLFARFDAGGTGWFAERVGGSLRLGVRAPGTAPAEIALGPLAEGDFVQEISPVPGGGALLTLWSGSVFVVRPAADDFHVARIDLELPADCAPPNGRSLLYTAVAHRDSVYATLFCGVSVLRAPLP